MVDAGCDNTGPEPGGHSEGQQSGRADLGGTRHIALRMNRWTPHPEPTEPSGRRASETSPGSGPGRKHRVQPELTAVAVGRLAWCRRGPRKMVESTRGGVGR
jgi:hypothetical protein